MKRGALKILALTLCSVLIMSAFASCSSAPAKPSGNLKEATLEEGDVFAVINILDYGSITLKLFPDIAPKAVQRFITLATRGYYNGRNFHRVINDFLVQGGSLTGTGYDGEVAEGEYFDVETSDNAKHFYGALCMAKSASGNYCQFYIVNNNEPVDITAKAAKLREQLDNTEITSKMLPEDIQYYEDYYSKLMAIPDAVKERYAEVGGDYELDGDYTVFGQTIDGFDVLEAISSVETVSGNVSDDKASTPSKPLNEIIIESIDVIRIASAEEGEETAKTSRITAASTVAPVEITTVAEETTSPDSSEDVEETAEEATEDTTEDGTVTDDTEMATA